MVCRQPHDAGAEVRNPVYGAAGPGRSAPGGTDRDHDAGDDHVWGASGPRSLDPHVQGSGHASGTQLRKAVVLREDSGRYHPDRALRRPGHRSDAQSDRRSRRPRTRARVPDIQGSQAVPEVPGGGEVVTRRRNADHGDAYIRELERRVLEGDLSLVSRLAAAYDRAGRGLDPLAVSRDMIRDAYWRDVRVVADEVAKRGEFELEQLTQ